MVPEMFTKQWCRIAEKCALFIDGTRVKGKILREKVTLSLAGMVG